MKRNRIIVGVGALALILIAAWWFRGAEASEGNPYRLAEVERGDLESAVSATGSLSAVTTVQVGTQVSGKVTGLFVDFNDRVKKGQLIARIDPTLQQQAVRDAEATIERSRAELDRAEREFERNKTLFERKVITDSEFNQAQYTLAVARANLKSAQVNLERARQNLAYTELYAPIDGIVVERNVEPGQTVAASMSTPQIFLIANDLSEMQILASVDESDIGRIKDGQPVRFTVQAYPDQQFEGRVRQVRLQSAATENVVSYTAVIAVENREGRLLPGMTASVDFMVESARDVLMVPNAALRFRPSEEMLAKLGDSTMLAAARGPGGGNGARAQGQAQVVRQGQGAQPQRGPGAAGQGARAAGQGGPGAGPRAGGAGGARPGGAGGFARLWYMKDGKLGVARVRTGITDGTKTEVSGPDLQEGMEIITGLNVSTAQGGTTNPFQGGGPGGAGGPVIRGPGGF